MPTYGMKRVHIVVHRARLSALLKDVYEFGRMEIDNVTDQAGELMEALSLSHPQLTDDHVQQHDVLNELESAILFLEEHSEQKRSMLDEMIPALLEYNSEDFQNIVKKTPYKEIMAEVERLEKGLSGIERRVARLQTQRETLGEWEGLDIDVESIRDTRNTRILLGSFPPEGYQALLASGELPADIHLEPVNENPKSVNCLAIIHKSADAAVTTVLKKYLFAEAKPPVETGSITAAARALDVEIQNLSKEQETFLSQSKELSRKVKDLKVIYDYLTKDTDVILVQQKLAVTREAALITGWVRKHDAKKLQGMVRDKYREAELMVRDPEPRETPPTAFNNNCYSEPYSFATQLYFPPKYGEVDPTPFIAPFFGIMFGICIGDGGYGLLIFLLSLWLNKKVKIEPSTKVFVRMLRSIGIWAMVIGVLMGGFWGFDFNPSYTPVFLIKIRNALMLVDPTGKPLNLLGVAVVIGILHLEVAYGIRGWLAYQSGGLMALIADNVTVMLGMPCMFLAILGFTEIAPIPKPIWTTASYIFGACTVFYLLFVGRNAGNIMGRMAGGIFETYLFLSGTLSDVLSYARLMALGIAGGVLAGAINTMAQQMPTVGEAVLKKPGYVLGLIIAPFVLIFGHLIMLTMGMMGAFIHTLRLQYLEFFQKFYEGGGRLFEPFRHRSKYTLVKD